MTEQLTIDSFYESGRKGKLTGLKCESGHITVPPRRSCRLCHSRRVEAVDLSGKGTVISYTEVQVKAKEFPIDTPYTLALVGLDEGGTLLGIMRGESEGLGHGSKVSVKFVDVKNEKWPRIFFEII